MAHSSLLPFIEGVLLILLSIACYQVNLDLRASSSQLHSPPLRFSECCQFESEVSPSSVKHFLEKLLYPNSYEIYLNFPLTFSRRIKAYCIFLKRSLAIFILKRFPNIDRGWPFNFLWIPMIFEFRIDLIISRSVSFFV